MCMCPCVCEAEREREREREREVNYRLAPAVFENRRLCQGGFSSPQRHEKIRRSLFAERGHIQSLTYSTETSLTTSY